MSLDSVLQRADVWRGGEQSLHRQVHNLPTGHAALDAQLSGGGWPVGALTECLLAQHGIGELRLLGPALARLSQAGRWLVWVNPPYLPYAPALNHAGVSLRHNILLQIETPDDQLWAIEQALRSGSCGAVLAWPQRIAPRQLRRLQLAAEMGSALGIVFRSLEVQHQHSPAALRLRLAAAASGLRLDILKCRGRFNSQPIVLENDHAVA
ncbi:MAG: hypothetical protein AMJ69_08055 [Gammaproteobacteria bacterium SG8_47]|nr:MAG: hypothetical protein AMJ69_08055 [Gammaproteobacteria bacterium SG8_47]